VLPSLGGRSHSRGDPGLGAATIPRNLRQQYKRLPLSAHLSRCSRLLLWVLNTPLLPVGPRGTLRGRKTVYPELRRAAAHGRTITRSLAAHRRAGAHPRSYSEAWALRHSSFKPTPSSQSPASLLQSKPLSPYSKTIHAPQLPQSHPASPPSLPGPPSAAPNNPESDFLRP
jgi:hypothetical protein